MSSVQCTNCKVWFTNSRNLMHHMGSCSAKYNHLELLNHNPLKSKYDACMSANISVPSFKEETSLLFEVERNKIDGTINDIVGSQHSTDGSDSDGANTVRFTQVMSGYLHVIASVHCQMTFIRTCLLP